MRDKKGTVAETTAMGSLPRVTAMPAGTTVTVAKVSAGQGIGTTPSSTASATGRSAQRAATAPTASSSDPLWDHSAKTWLTDMIVLVLLGLERRIGEYR